jgi:RND family efflux transporter MFP subunit
VRLADATIVSPLDGVVGEKLAERGDLASPGKPLLVLHDPARLRLEVAVEERLLLELKRGDLLAVSLEALGTEQRSPVDEIVPAVDPLTRTGLVKIDLPRLPGARPGTFGRARIPAGRRPAIVVPRSALLRRGQLEIVFTVERSPDGTPRARLVLVRAGEEVSIAGAEPSVEILSGLEAGALLVAREVEDLRDGAPLEAAELPEPDAPAGDPGRPSPAPPGRPAKQSGRP